MAIQNVDRKKNKHLFKVLPRKAPPLVKRGNKSSREQLAIGRMPMSWFYHYSRFPF